MVVNMFLKFKLLKQDLLAYFWFSSFKLKKILSFKTSFYLQAGFMFINNIFLIFAWWLLFQNFGNINGYSFRDIIFIHGFLSLWYAILLILFEGVLSLGEIISKDGLLNYQLYPVSALGVILARGKSLSVYGDFLYGLVFLIIYLILGGSLNIPIAMIALIISILGMFGIFLVLNSLAFFIPNILGIQDLIFNFFLGSGFYPSQNFQGISKTILNILLITALVFIPLEVVGGFSSFYFLIYTLIAAIILNLTGFWLWDKGLKRAESGSGGGLVE